MKIFFCPKLITLHNVIMNTACSEPLMEGRQEEWSKDREKRQINQSQYLANKFSTICHVVTAPKKSPYIELQDYQEKPFGSHSFSFPQNALGSKKKLVSRQFHIC